MSKYWEIIERVDEVAPNALSQKTKFDWLMVLEGKIAADVLQLNINEIRALPHQYDRDRENEPLVPFPHEEMYDLWLRAKIHEGTGEYDHYQNVMQLFNEAYRNFVRWYAHTYQTARGRQHDTHAGWEECDGFFLTAYGLAVKQGFRGSLDEWLLSITGPRGPEGRTAYQYAVMQGYTGTEAEFGNLLQQGKTAYQYAQEGGYNGTVEQFRAKMAMEYAALNHDHQGVYAPNQHDHTGAYAPDKHTHNANEVNEGVLSTDRIPVVPLTKGGHGGANRKDGFKNLAYLGDNPVTVATDTPSSWVALGSGFAGISTVCTVNQPDTHGSIFSLVVSDYNVQQIFICLNGELLYRGGNPEYGWFHWRSVLTKDGGVFTGPVTTKGIHLTPGVDYGTEFPADAEEGRLFRIKVGVDNG